MLVRLTREQKEWLINQIQSYFETERSENIGELAAGNLLEFMIEQLGPYVYNQAIGDARVLAMQQMERVEEEMYALEKPIRTR